jgi:hypothetical protein
MPIMTHVFVGHVRHGWKRCSCVRTCSRAKQRCSSRKSIPWYCTAVMLMYCCGSASVALVLGWTLRGWLFDASRLPLRFPQRTALNDYRSTMNLHTFQLLGYNYYWLTTRPDWWSVSTRSLFYRHQWVPLCAAEGLRKMYMLCARNLIPRTWSSPSVPQCTYRIIMFCFDYSVN